MLIEKANSTIGQKIKLPAYNTLSQVAYNKYGDTKMWREIADFNSEYNLFAINSNGVEINLPSKDKALGILKDKLKSKLNPLLNTEANTQVNDGVHQLIDWIL